MFRTTFGGPFSDRRNITLNARNKVEDLDEIGWKSNFIQDEVCDTTEFDDGCNAFHTEYASFNHQF